MEIISSVIDSLKYFIPDILVNFIIVLGFVIFVLMWVIPRLMSGLNIGRRYLQNLTDLFNLTNEFKKNGGSSIKDSIDRIEENVVQTRDDISVLSGKINSIFYVVGKESGIAVFEANSVGKVIYACRRWTELTGLSGQESVGYGWQNAIFEADKDRVIKSFDEAVEDGREFYIYYSIFNRVTNEIIQVESYSLIIRDSLGLPIRYIIVISPNDEKI